MSPFAFGTFAGHSNNAVVREIVLNRPTSQERLVLLDDSDRASILSFERATEDRWQDVDVHS